MRYVLALIALILTLGLPSSLHAQDLETIVQEAVNSEEEGAAAGSISDAEDLNPARIPSILFTFWEHTAIRDAKRARGNVRAPTEAELMKDLGFKDTERVKPPAYTRDIRLGGIVFVSNADWVIWLNDKRVTPDALPREALDLFVSKEYIELKWFDEWTNQIYPIRLRPHERFNIDTRIFLPG